VGDHISVSGSIFENFTPSPHPPKEMTRTYLGWRGGGDFFPKGADQAILKFINSTKDKSNTLLLLVLRENEYGYVERDDNRIFS
jgi:hypothetical protein